MRTPSIKWNLRCKKYHKDQKKREKKQLTRRVRYSKMNDIHELTVDMREVDTTSCTRSGQNKVRYRRESGFILALYQIRRLSSRDEYSKR